MVLSAEGCRQRRLRFWQQLDPPPDSDYLVLADPLHLIYLANFHVDPFSLSGGFRGYLILRSDGHAKLIHDNLLAGFAQRAHVEERRPVAWYDFESPGRGARQLAPLAEVNPHGRGLRVHDRVGDPYAPTVIQTLADMRRVKHGDEIEALRHCMRAGDAGHAWARKNVRPGMTELDVYRGVNGACTEAAGQAVIVYGDFAVSPGPERRGGPPTHRVIHEGDLFILDFSVVIGGYRSDFTNTLAVGGSPKAEQVRNFKLCQEAMAAGEQELRAGAACKAVFDAVNGVFERAGVAEHFGDRSPHHVGHGIGLSHPEAPYIVRYATETLRSGDVVTLEPGLYVSGVGGMRIEHNYLIKEDGYERLSNHIIALS
jgi:Xaa-Pro aminopeptidase